MFQNCVVYRNYLCKVRFCFSHKFRYIHVYVILPIKIKKKYITYVCIFEVNELYILKRKNRISKVVFNTFLLFLFLQDVRKMDSEHRENAEPPVKFTTSTSSTSLVSYFNYSFFQGSFTNYVLQEEGCRYSKKVDFLSTVGR